MAKLQVKASVHDKDKGYAKLAADLDGMGTVTLGVQGNEASAQHPNAGMSVGALATMHELGLGVPERSWLRKWMDLNQARMLKETKTALKEVTAGRTTRKKALAALGYRWVVELRDWIAAGNVTPPISASWAAAKGHSIPLLDTATLVNAITYKLFLPQIKSIKGSKQRAVVRGQLTVDFPE